MNFEAVGLKPFDRAKVDYRAHDHAVRYRRHVLSRKPRLMCQECRGRGEIREDVIAEHTLWTTCGFCLGTGYVTAWHRHLWLRYAKEEKWHRVMRTLAGRSNR